ncbi:undecaprenyl-diphosphate phosphatase [Halalkalibacter urbisdiaboli]|uniref:undecaprenyl-diphosphate phosphatase n=1 Tax=Halalkalibacter urbisdiaboli TaxID=1960589 RepID=UPI000B43B1B1|nr:undecaprenyl-diphosphate phosphatase [Halalkalibacter urbisdiaboli]
MNWFEAILIGFIQGISEFLPISSTAHLLIVEKLLSIQIGENSLTFEVFLHFASLLAVFYYFRDELKQILLDFLLFTFKRKQRSRQNFRFAVLMLVSTLVTMIVGKTIEEGFGEGLTSTATIGASLIITGIFLVLVEHGMNTGKRGLSELTWKDGILIGLGQALAVIPGISRSGSTLVAALWCGLKKEVALRYSFLLSIPIIGGLTLLKLPEISTNFFQSEAIIPLILSFISAFIFAIVGIKWLISMVQNTKLSYFACYCIALGVITWTFM